MASSMASAQGCRAVRGRVGGAGGRTALGRSWMRRRSMASRARLSMPSSHRLKRIGWRSSLRSSSSSGMSWAEVAYFVVEATRHHTNLYVVLVGPTAKGRKGTSEGWALQLFVAVDPEYIGGCLQSGMSSGEGVIWAVRDPVVKTEAIKEKGVTKGYQEVIEHQGVADKRSLYREPEFGQVLRVIRREGSTLTTTVREAWDSGNLKVTTKNSPARTTGAHISITGHITQEELRHCLAVVEGFNGFANRFLWPCVRRSKLLPFGGEPVDLEPFVTRLRTAVNFAKSAGRLTRDEEADRLWAAVYEELAASHQGLFGAVTSRAEAQVLRLSMIYALLDESAIIRAEHLRAARALWKYCEDSARYIFGDSTGDRLADKVLAIIRTGPVTTKEIHDGTNRHLQRQGVEARARQVGGDAAHQIRECSNRWSPRSAVVAGLTSRYRALAS